MVQIDFLILLSSDILKESNPDYTFNIRILGFDVKPNPSNLLLAKFHCCALSNNVALLVGILLRMCTEQISYSRPG